MPLCWAPPGSLSSAPVPQKKDTAFPGFSPQEGHRAERAQSLGRVTSYPFAVLVEKAASSSQGLADPGPRTSLGSMGTWGFLPQLSLTSRVTDEWAPAWPRADLTQEGFDFCDSSFIGINVQLLPRSAWRGSPSGGHAQISGAESQPGALRKGPGLLRVWGWWPIGGAGSPSAEMSLDEAFGLSCAAGGCLGPSATAHQGSYLQ